ncbi:hypothetical protein X801_09143 [Opisthorchis viverrini]|uniref:Uncharacterized protein n=1 Tax=Opisthorchis viverrini TaxID=6198 RepID=A0A1S8WKT4_OPIVI|nr:hypothetical protein X801_09143 [Opisthorchis viverrini]
MIPYTCMMAKWIPDGQVFTLVWANGSVHVVMYTYYALAALGPAWRRFLWWKRYLTILQMCINHAALQQAEECQLGYGFINIYE